MLHFSHDQLIWDCCELTACETYPQGLPKLLDGQRVIQYKSLNPNLYLSSKVASHPTWDWNLDTATYFMWINIVETYSRSSLTVPSDKLVALSGIAKRLRSMTKDQYVAGMWRSCLQLYLLWCVDAEKKVNDYRAPSWSWASVASLVWSYHISIERPAVYVRKIRLEYATEDTTGALTGGWLDLNVPLKPMHLMKLQDGHQSLWYIVVNGTIACRKDSSGQPTQSMQHIYLDTPPTGDDDFDADNTAQTLYFVPLHRSPNEQDLISALLLRLVHFNEKFYESIGVTNVWRGDGQEVLMADVSEEVKINIPCHSYVNGLHTIQII